MNLYEISEEFNRLNELIAENYGEISEEIEDLEVYIKDLLTTKTDGMVHFVNRLEDECDVADKHIERLQAYKKVRKNAIANLKNYTADCMTKLGTKKIKGEISEISLSKPRKLVSITDANKIPLHLLKTTVEPDKTEIKKVLDMNVEVDGARLIDSKPSVKYRLKTLK